MILSVALRACLSCVALLCFSAGQNSVVATGRPSDNQWDFSLTPESIEAMLQADFWRPTDQDQGRGSGLSFQYRITPNQELPVGTSYWIDDPAPPPRQTVPFQELPVGTHHLVRRPHARSEPPPFTSFAAGSPEIGERSASPARSARSESVSSAHSSELDEMITHASPRLQAFENFLASSRDHSPASTSGPSSLSPYNSASPIIPRSSNSSSRAQQPLAPAATVAAAIPRIEITATGPSTAVPLVRRAAVDCHFLTIEQHVPSVRGRTRRHSDLEAVSDRTLGIEVWQRQRSVLPRSSRSTGRRQVAPRESQCTGCPGQFRTQTEWERHRVNDHQGATEAHVCILDDCDRSFATTGELEKHVAEQH